MTFVTFGTKNVGAAMGDLDGHIIPASSNSCRVLSSACCSASVRRYCLAGFGSLVSHPSMKSIGKFHSFQSSGIYFACQLSNTSRKGWSSWSTCGLGSVKVVPSTPYISASLCLVGICSRHTWGSIFRQFSWQYCKENIRSLSAIQIHGSCISIHGIPRTSECCPVGIMSITIVSMCDRVCSLKIACSVTTARSHPCMSLVVRGSFLGIVWIPCFSTKSQWMKFAVAPVSSIAFTFMTPLISTGMLKCLEI